MHLAANKADPSGRSHRKTLAKPLFPDFATIAMVEAEVEREGKISIARRYFLSLAKLDTKTLAHAVRAHWKIENRLH